MAQSSFIHKFINNDYFIIYVFIIIFIIFTILQILYYSLTKFTKTITIKDKYTNSNRNTIIYTIVDSDNKIYNIENVWFLFDFNKGENYNMIKVNSTYIVSGYGFTIDMFSLYPTVYNATPA